MSDFEAEKFAKLEALAALDKAQAGEAMLPGSVAPLVLEQLQDEVDAILKNRVDELSSEDDHVDVHGRHIEVDLEDYLVLAYGEGIIGEEDHIRSKEQFLTDYLTGRKGEQYARFYSNGSSFYTLERGVLDDDKPHYEIVVEEDTVDGERIVERIRPLMVIGTAWRWACRYDEQDKHRPHLRKPAEEFDQTRVVVNGWADLGKRRARAKDIMVAVGADDIESMIDSVATDGLRKAWQMLQNPPAAQKNLVESYSRSKWSW